MGCPKSPPALVTSFGDANSDGLLSFDEIARLRLDANLVVLSACDTGSGIRSQDIARLSGQEEAGSTLEGLVRAFLTANARSVLATHWEVPAAVGTPELMEAFYTSARTQDIGGSLQTGAAPAHGAAEILASVLLGRVFHRRRREEVGAGARAGGDGGSVASVLIRSANDITEPMTSWSKQWGLRSGETIVRSSRHGAGRPGQGYGLLVRLGDDADPVEGAQSSGNHVRDDR